MSTVIVGLLHWITLNCPCAANILITVSVSVSGVVLVHCRSNKPFAVIYGMRYKILRERFLVLVCISYVLP